MAPKVGKRRGKELSGNALSASESRNTEKNMDNVDEAASEGTIDEENLLEMQIPPMADLLIMSSDGQSERLVISHIEVENFKSYYGRQTIGPFHQNFTAIIGPNGSGKSNVIDSLLFVFGYRASKIRSKKISVLIHSSTGRENIASCTVSVHFKKIRVRDEVVETVAGSEFFVSRTAYRDNSSRYTLDGRTTQFRDIAVVLRQSGIDLVHNRFLILQGEVEHISLMKPKAQNENEEGMLEYLEDIIGSSRLKVLINKLVAKLSRLQEQRAYQLVRLHHAEKEQQQLRESAVAVVMRLRLENAIAVAQAKLYSVKKLALAAEIDTLKTIRVNQATQLAEKQKEYDDMMANAKGLQKEHKQLQRNLEKKQEALTALSAKLGTKKQAITKIESDKKRLIDQREKLESNIVKEHEKIAELKSVPERASQKLATYEVELAEAETIIRENIVHVDTKLPLVQERTSALSASRQTLEAELNRHIMVEDKCAAELALAQEALSNLQREESAQRRILAEFCDRLEQMEEQLATKSSYLETTRATLPRLEGDLAKHRADETRLADEERCLVEETRTLRADVEQARQAAAQFQSSNSLLSAIMEQKTSGRIRGIYGRLGDLGAIDTKYDVAISTTCGALDNIVVDNVETAQQCIKFLQRKNLGVASFIALDKQQHCWQRIRSKPKTPDNTPRLFDLVRVEDENVLPAFYYALNDTLVAADIQSATRIGMNSGAQRWRTVTLKGEVVEVSGAMTGGGNRQQSGRIACKVRVNTSNQSNASRGEIDMKALAERLQTAEAQLAEVRNKLARCCQHVRECQADLTRSTQMVKNLGADVELLQKNTETARQQIVDQKKKLRNAIVNPEVVQQHNDCVSQLKKENDEYSRQSNSLRLRSIEISEEINRVEEEIVGQYQRALREAEERKRTTEKGIAKEKNAITSNARNLRNANCRMTDLESDLNQVIVNIAKLEENIDILTAELSELEKQAEEHRATIIDAEAVYNEVVERARQLNTGEIEAGRRVTELRDELAKTDEQLGHTRSKMDDVNGRMSKLKLYDLLKLDGITAELLEQGKDDPLLADSFAITASERNEDSEEDEDAEVSGDGPEDEMETEVESPDEEENVKEKRRNPLENFLSSGAVPMVRAPRFATETVREFDVTVLKEQLEDLDAREKQAKRDSSANIGVLLDYIQKAKLHDAELTCFQRISRERDAHREFCERLKRQRLQEFMDGFQTINERLKQLYQMITLGGDASLDLVDSLDPFSEGVSFGVRPPKKSWKQITNLSGGEKTLASLALVFGLHRFRPTPLYVMDEIDAALDFRNVSIISSYILERTTNAQFIVISLRNNMFERGNRLIGIYKVRDCTHNVVLDPVAAQKQLIKNMKAVEYAKAREREEEELEMREPAVISDFSAGPTFKQLSMSPGIAMRFMSTRRPRTIKFEPVVVEANPEVEPSPCSTRRRIFPIDEKTIKKERNV